MGRNRSRAIGSAGGSALEVSIAALAGASVAFLAFAAPADRLTDLVDALGVTAILHGSEPLGIAARIAVGAAGGAIASALAWLLLRWLDRFGRPAENPELMLDAALSVAVEAPRRRRADVPPDALEPASVPAGPPPIGSNIPDLMERLEQGLARLRSAAREAPPAGRPLPPGSDDERLQGAIEGLRRLAARRQ